MGSHHSVTLRRGMYRGWGVGLDGHNSGSDAPIFVQAETPIPPGAGAGVRPVAVRFGTRPGMPGYEVAEAALYGGVDELEPALSWLLLHLESRPPAEIGTAAPAVAALLAAAVKSRAAYHPADDAPFTVIFNSTPAPVPAADAWADAFTVHARPADAPLDLVPQYAAALWPDVIPAGIDAAALESMTAEVRDAWHDDRALTTAERMRALRAVWVATLARHGYAPADGGPRGDLVTACGAAERSPAAEALRAAGHGVTVRPVRLAD